MISIRKSFNFRILSPNKMAETDVNEDLLDYEEEEAAEVKWSVTVGLFKLEDY